MLVSHECPLELLNTSKSFNDYGYALVHLFDELPEYKQFYYDLIKEQKVYLDNSLFELKTVFNPGIFAKECEDLGSQNPNNFYYVVPDAWQDTEKTIKLFDNFKFDLPGKKIAVAQGSNTNEILECALYLKDRTDILAFSFDLEAWDIKKFEYKPKNKMYGRLRFFEDNLKHFENTKIHLLGSQLPQEVCIYKNYKNVVSIDTSHPIASGIEGIRYFDSGCFKKPMFKVPMNMDIKLNEIQLELINHNIKIFKKLAK